MNYVNKQIVTEQQASSALVLCFAKVWDHMRRLEPLVLIWWCLALSILSSTTTRYLTEKSGFAYDALLVLGSGGCVWFWFLSRTLFRKTKGLGLGAIVVPVVIAIEAIHALMPPTGLNGTSGEFGRVFSNVASLVCIAAIVYVWNEALSGFSKIRSVEERRFRMVFLGVFSLPVAVAILWVMGAETGSFAAEWKDVLLTFCALTGLVGSRFAVEYRLKTSREKTAHFNPDRNGANDAAVSALLAQKIRKAIQNDALLTKPNLKVSELAEYIGEQEYKVTRCITSQLQYRNFNQLVNSHRINRAIQVFKDPKSSHLTIATIAFDCGFNSLGPFNRAFKQHTGMTPREYRQMETQSEP